MSASNPVDPRPADPAAGAGPRPRGGPSAKTTTDLSKDEIDEALRSLHKVAERGHPRPPDPPDQP